MSHVTNDPQSKERLNIFIMTESVDHPFIKEIVDELNIDYDINILGKNYSEKTLIISPTHQPMAIHDIAHRLRFEKHKSLVIIDSHILPNIKLHIRLFKLEHCIVANISNDLDPKINLAKYVQYNEAEPEISILHLKYILTTRYKMVSGDHVWNDKLFINDKSDFPDSLLDFVVKGIYSKNDVDFKQFDINIQKIKSKINKTTDVEKCIMLVKLIHFLEMRYPSRYSMIMAGTYIIHHNLDNIFKDKELKKPQHITSCSVTGFDANTLNQHKIVLLVPFNSKKNYLPEKVQPIAEFLLKYQDKPHINYIPIVYKIKDPMIGVNFLLKKYTPVETMFRLIRVFKILLTIESSYEQNFLIKNNMVLISQIGIHISPDDLSTSFTTLGKFLIHCCQPKPSIKLITKLILKILDETIKNIPPKDYLYFKFSSIEFNDPEYVTQQLATRQNTQITINNIIKSGVIGLQIQLKILERLLLCSDMLIVYNMMFHVLCVFDCSFCDLPMELLKHGVDYMTLAEVILGQSNIDIFVKDTIKEALIL